MNEKDSAINRHFSQKKTGSELVDVVIQKNNDAQFTQGALFSNKTEGVTIKDTVKTVDKNTTKEMLNKSNYNLTTGKYVSYMAKSHRAEVNVINEDRIIEKAKKMDRRLRYGAAITAGVVGVGTLLDLGGGFKERKEIQRDLAEQEKQMKIRQSDEAKSMKRKSHDYVDMGEIVQEMFNERIGHYKMGNSKFQ